MPIFWTQFDWPSFATLAAGSLAVGGAMFIGRKQNKILAAQSDISARQLQLAEADLRFQLFSMRIDLYKRMRSICYAAIDGTLPTKSDGFQQFYDAMLDCHFLFPDEIHDHLSSILQSLIKIDQDRDEFVEGNFPCTREEFEAKITRVRKLWNLNAELMRREINPAHGLKR